MQSIKNIYCCKENLLIVDLNNMLWVMGNNTAKFGYAKAIYSPYNLQIILNDNDDMSKFYSSGKLIVVYTILGNLYVSSYDNTHITNNNIASDRYDGQMDDGSNDQTDDGPNDQTDDASDDQLDDNQILDVFNAIRFNESMNANGIISQFDNNRHLYNRSQLNYGHTGKTYLHLLEQAVSAITCSCNTVFFKKNDTLYLYTLDISNYNMVDRFGGLILLPINCDICQYYQMIFPFVCDNIVPKNNFVYVKSGAYHHVLAININLVDDETDDDIENNDEIFYWNYFSSQLAINHDQIYLAIDQATIYVMQGNQCYKYSEMVKDIKLYIDNDQMIKTFIIQTNDGESDFLICVNNNGIYEDEDGDLKQIIGYHPYINHIVNMNFGHNLFGPELILVNVPNEKRFTVHTNDLLFNINGIEYYKLFDSGLIYYDADKIYYLSSNQIRASHYNIKEIEKINTKIGGECFYLYIFNDIPLVIKQIKFTNNLVIIQSDNDWFYQTIDTDVFRVNIFTKIIISDWVKNNTLVNNHILIIRRKKFGDDYPINI